MNWNHFVSDAKPAITDQGVHNCKFARECIAWDQSLLLVQAKRAARGRGKSLSPAPRFRVSSRVPLEGILFTISPNGELARRLESVPFHNLFWCVCKELGLFFSFGKDLIYLLY